MYILDSAWLLFHLMADGNEYEDGKRIILVIPKPLFTWRYPNVKKNNRAVRIRKDKVYLFVSTVGYGPDGSTVEKRRVSCHND